MTTQRDDWNLVMVKARRAQAMLPRGSGGNHIDWGDVTVAHLDTGYSEHPVFGNWQTGDIWLRPSDGLNLREPDSLPLDPLDYEGNPGHGTRTASILCGVSDDPAVSSEVGVAPRLPTLPCRVVDRVVLTPESQRERVAAGIRHAIKKKCKVVSISLGTPFFLPGTTGGMGRAVDKAYEAGLIIVAAAGQIIQSVTYPGKYNRTICAGGVTWQRRVWWNYDAGLDMVDVWAPAKDVLRADVQSTSPNMALASVEGDDPGSFSSGSGSSSGGYGKGTGTSYATVHVAASAAMWLTLRGDEISQKYGEPWQRVEAFRALLKHTGGSLNGSTPANGSGLLDIQALLQAPLPLARTLKKAAKDKNKTS